MALDGKRSDPIRRNEIGAWHWIAEGQAMRERLRWLTARPIAHRGYHDLRRGRPENTLAAFDAAVAAHYAIECDLHISADGVPVVFHDDDLERL